ncbi:MAG: hypothetical protein IPJ19_07810 [Planctomycetes bacterium]|nr:hypothetical protein [Planctomycetota bacterium]
MLHALARCVAFALLAAGFAPAPDRLAEEVQRCVALAADKQTSEEFSSSVRSSSVAPLQQVEADLAAGRRFAALHRFASLRINLEGVRYVDGLAADKRDEEAFEAEWKSVGERLARHGSRAAQLRGIANAALRAEAEATLPQAGILREASLEYARSTEPKFGLFYLGSALAADDFVDLCASLDVHSDKRPPSLRSVRAEIDALQQELLAAYKPPLSVERHSAFIGASSALKEARALDAQGRPYGALLRMLTAAARCEMLLDSSPAPTTEGLAYLIDSNATRIEAGDVDHSIAQVFLELARAEVAAAPGTSPPIAVAIAKRSLPLYFRALRPAEPTAEPARAEVDLTLVRWPFT